MLLSKKESIIGLLSFLIVIISFNLTQSQSYIKIQNQQSLKSQKEENKIIHQVDSKQNSINLKLDQTLQFSNYTGDAITSDMVTNYVKIINNAYSLYGSNINVLTDYISKQLQTSYGWTYSVVILLANESINTWLIYNVGNRVVIWNSVNTYQTNWTYIIWPLSRYSSQTTNYISGLGKGSGIDSSKEVFIRNIIKMQQEKYSECMCLQEDIIQINNKLRQFDGQSWTVICKKFSSISFNSLLKTHNNQYIQLFISTNKCEYIIAACLNHQQN